MTPPGLQARRRAYPDLMTTENFGVTGLGRRSNQIVSSFRITATEGSQRETVEGVTAPLALYGVNLVSPSLYNEIHLMSRFVTPIADRGIRETRLQVFEHNVLPENAHIFGT
jgi:hypothetical protein